MLFTLSLLILLASSDLKFHLIPKRVNFLALGSIVPVISIAGLLWAVGIYFLYLALFRLSRGGIGYGDVRLAPVAAILLPEASPTTAHLLAWVISGGYAIFTNQGKQVRLPFAPALLSSVIFLEVRY